MTRGPGRPFAMIGGKHPGIALVHPGQLVAIEPADQFAIAGTGGGAAHFWVVGVFRLGRGRQQPGQ